MQTFTPTFSEISALLVSQIIFDHSEWVSIWGSFPSGEKERKMDFITDFDTLNRLLRLSGKTGDDIGMMLVEKMEGEWEEPMVVDIESRYGRPLLLDRCRLKVYHPQEEDAQGRLMVDENCLFIDEVTPLLEKKTIIKIKKNPYREELDKCMELLSSGYKLYLGYLELELDEAAARQKAGLEDELKFRTAFYAWKQE